MASFKKVLIVDDSQLIHQMYKLVFWKYKDCQLINAYNGLEALDVLSKEDGFDLIILDINMPVMNGIQFMEKVKGEGLYRNVPIVVISTEGKEEDTMRALRLGAWGYLVKPFKSESLYDLLDKVYSKKLSVLSTGKYV